jgi:hypothetical protein
MARKLATDTRASAPQARDPNATVQLNLRIKEHERVRLEAAARSKGVSLNGLISALVMDGLKQERLLTQQHVLDSIEIQLKPLLTLTLELGVSVDYRRTVSNLLALLQPVVMLGDHSIDGKTREAFLALIEAITKAEIALDAKAGQRFKRLRTMEALVEDLEDVARLEGSARI